MESVNDDAGEKRLARRLKDSMLKDSLKRIKLFFRGKNTKLLLINILLVIRILPAIKLIKQYDLFVNSGLHTMNLNACNHTKIKL